MYWLWYVLILFLLTGIRVVKEYQRGVTFTLGKYTGMKKPGLRYVVPIIQRMPVIDIRVKALDIPSQDCITKDNVTVRVNAVLYYKVEYANKAIIEVEDYNYAVSQLAQTTMRNIVGEFELDELLQKREEISLKIAEIVDKATDPWGIDVVNIEVKDIELPDSLKRTISKVAEAERERRAVIVKSEGEVSASENLAKAATTLAKTSGALHLRTLHTLNDLSSDQSNTVVMTIPLEILKAFDNKK